MSHVNSYQGDTSASSVSEAAHKDHITLSITNRIPKSLPYGEPYLGNSHDLTITSLYIMIFTMLQIHMQVENEHYSTVSGLIRLVISLECFIEITPDFL